MTDNACWRNSLDLEMRKDTLVFLKSSLNDAYVNITLLRLWPGSSVCHNRRRPTFVAFSLMVLLTLQSWTAPYCMKWFPWRTLRSYFRLLGCSSPKTPLNSQPQSKTGFSSTVPSSKSTLQAYQCLCSWTRRSETSSVSSILLGSSCTSTEVLSKRACLPAELPTFYEPQFHLCKKHLYIIFFGSFYALVHPLAEEMGVLVIGSVLIVRNLLKDGYFNIRLQLGLIL